MTRWPRTGSHPVVDPFNDQVDSEGVVTHAWIGQLDADGEADVFNALVGF